MDYFLDALWPDPEAVRDRGLAFWFADFAERRAGSYVGTDHATRCRLWDLARRYTARAMVLLTQSELRGEFAA